MSANQVDHKTGLKLQSAASKASLPGSAALFEGLFGKEKRNKNREEVAAQTLTTVRDLMHLEQVSELASALRSSREEVAAQVAAATAKDRENSQLWEQVGLPSA